MNHQASVIGVPVACWAKRDQVHKVVGFFARSKFSIWADVVNGQLFAQRIFSDAATSTRTTITFTRLAALLRPVSTPLLAVFTAAPVWMPFGIASIVVPQFFGSSFALRIRSWSGLPAAVAFTDAMSRATTATTTVAFRCGALFDRECRSAPSALHDDLFSLALHRAMAYAICSACNNRKLFATRGACHFDLSKASQARALIPAKLPTTFPFPRAWCEWLSALLTSDFHGWNYTNYRLPVTV